MKKSIGIIFSCLILLLVGNICVQASVIAGADNAEQNHILEGAIEINEERFPDAVFREVLTDISREMFGAEMEGYLIPEKIKRIQNVDGVGIRSLKGIELFKNLETLHCYRNQVTSVDFSKNTKLRSVNLMNNNLKSVKLGNHPNLKSLQVAYNDITSLDISGCPNLQGLVCQSNRIKELDTLNNSKLEYINCQGNQLKTVNLTKNRQLVTFTADDNYLTSIKTDGLMPKLEYITVDGNCLKKVPSSWSEKPNAILTPQREADAVVDESMKISFSALDQLGQAFKWYYEAEGYRVKLSGLKVDTKNKQFIVRPFEGDKKDVSFTAAFINPQGDCIRKLSCTIHVKKKNGILQEKVEQPDLISARVIASKQIQIKWKKVPNASGYRIYRRNGSSEWEKIKDCTSAAYIDKNVTLAQTYTYTVRAYRKIGTKTIWSTYDKNGISVTAVQGAPKLLKTDSSSKGITIKWARDTMAQSYNIYRKLPGESWKRIKTGVKSTSYIDTTAKKNKVYTYTVRSIYKISGKNILSIYDEKGITGMRK